MTDKLREAAQQALQCLEELQGGCTDSNDGTVEAITVWCPEVIDAIRAALAEQPAEQSTNPVGAVFQESKKDLMWSTVAMQKRHDERIVRIVNTLEQIKQEQLAEQPASLDWVSLNKAADEIVRSKPTWKRFIDSTPLANDIACWMADFALEHTASHFSFAESKPSQPAEQEPVAFVDDAGAIVVCSYKYKPGDKLYAHPPKREPLTDQEIVDLCDGTLTTWEQVRIARAIEAAHGIK